MKTIWFRHARPVFTENLTALDFFSIVVVKKMTENLLGKGFFEFIIQSQPITERSQARNSTGSGNQNQELKQRPEQNVPYWLFPYG